MAVTIKSPREIELMRKAGEILAQVHEELHAAVHPGMSTLDIDKLGERLIRSHGCIPSFKNYNGYPASICVSVNDEIVHGIPNKHRILKDGDIVSLDAGTIYKGYHSDAARTWAVGNVSPEAQKLMDDISTAIQAYAEKFGYGVVRELVGHGIGTHLHEDPEVPNFATKRRGILLQPGMTLAIEPMINAGTPDVIWMDDDWTVVTADHALSAHYENTILITEGEPEILSLRPGLE